MWIRRPRRGKAYFLEEGLMVVPLRSKDLQPQRKLIMSSVRTSHRPMFQLSILPLFVLSGTVPAPTTTHPQEASRLLYKSPLLVPPPHPVEPSTSLSISPPGPIQSLPVKIPQQFQSPASPTEKESTIVEKAVGIVSSAGAFLGLWHP